MNHPLYYSLQQVCNDESYGKELEALVDEKCFTWVCAHVFCDKGMLAVEQEAKEATNKIEKTKETSKKVDESSTEENKEEV